MSRFDTFRDYGERGWKAGMGELGGFRKFILRGNVVDLAVGIVIGAAFTGVVQELVNDFLQPLIGIILATAGFKQNFKDAYWLLAGQKFFYGNFVGAVITFLLTALVLYFFVVRPVTALQDRFTPKKEPEAPTTRECPYCLSTIPLKATRCAYCTAQLPPSEEPQQVAARS
ncbi:large conductance mechanosensitive channel protein MscL [Ktedonobacter racemifer]|uniref:Large-conductance mechanosensitive channel n=1 Tax=Ktedonobacter racemifer DSM 44963 TaxID=485913 RepID=D6TDM7_KTERA|nr:large conductance mechanosensitive channel protein MscL [Ktedonobacter racemifer]EFH90159.1 large conductance mechanosensitive channel protein [Ktedonobacter racemifer DSM 44963]